MRYTLTGACPRCGAPIYAMTRNEQKVADSGSNADWSGEGAPAAYFTCECRKALPEPLPDLDPDGFETIGDADRRFLAKHRPGEEGEPASGERLSE